MESKQRVNRSSLFWMVYLPRFVAVFVLLLISVGVVAAMVATKKTTEMKPPATSAVLVKTIESTHRPSARIWSGYGTVGTMGSADIVAEVAGRVIERPVSIEPGQRVQAGDLIVRLDDSDYINALDAARNAVKSLESQIDGIKIESEQLSLQVQFAQQEIEAAGRDLARIDESISAGAGSVGERDVKLASMLRSQRERSVLQQQLDLLPSKRARLEAEVASQRANERIAQENVERSMIRAPFSGELQSVNSRVGDWLAGGAPVARLVDLARLEIPLKVPATSSSWIKMGNEVKLWVSEPGGEPDQIGKIMRIAPEADASNRTITVFVEVKQDPSAADRLLPGQFVHGRVVTEDPYQRVILPRGSVQSNQVFVAQQQPDGSRRIEVMPVRVAYSFEARMPELDPIETQWVALKIGYEPVEGSQIAVSLLDQMIEGMNVRIGSDPVVNSQVEEVEAASEGGNP